jgi:alpha/beta superfamily hydrolase
LYSVFVPDAPSAIRSLFLDGPAGQLEALLNSGARDAKYAAVVCHPHPMYGGTLHNKVVFHAMKALNNLGMPVLRFNFRGAGLSHGEHDQGAGEVDDVRTALEWLDREFHLPIVFAGFSFGAAVGLRAAVPDVRVPALISLGTPISPVDNRSYDYDLLVSSTKPKLFVSGSRDQFATPARLQALVQTLADPKKLVIIEAADHFFEGRLREMREAVENWTKVTLHV